MADLGTLADPTDFGNKPGDGPLRAGGQSPNGDIKTEDNLPSTLSPSAKEQRPALELVRDVWGGNEVLRRKAAGYLPKAAGEDQSEYRNRVARSVFFNAFKRTVEGLTGLVFRVDPVLGDDVPAQIQKHWENIDDRGTHGDVFARDLLQDDLIAGHCAILVEYPRVAESAQTDGTQARLEAEGRLRPYWVPIKKDDILSWRTATDYGRSILAQVVIRESTYAPVGMFGERMQVRYRVLYRTTQDSGDAVVGFRVMEITEDKTLVEVDAGLYSNQDEIPLSEITSAGKKGTLESTPPLLDLAYLNVAHFQQWSDYAFSIHKTCVPFVFGAGIESRDAEGNEVKLIVGPNTAVLQSNPDAKMQYVAHDGASLGEVKKALDDLKADMGTLGLEMLAPQKRTSETLGAKRLDKATGDSALAVTARGLQDGLERALMFHARYLGKDSGGSITINRDFEGLLTEAPVMSAFAQLVNVGLPPRPVLEALQQGGRISAETNLDELEVEWLMGVAAKEAEQEAQREAMTADPDPLEDAE